MISFFQQAIDFFKLLLDFLINIVHSLLTLLTQIPRWVAFTTTLFGFLPSVLLSFALFAVSLSVIFLLIGRN